MIWTNRMYAFHSEVQQMVLIPVAPTTAAAAADDDDDEVL